MTSSLFKHIFLFTLTLISFMSVAQPLDGQVMDSMKVAQELDSLKYELDYSKTVPERYEASFYKALSYYPELDSSRIIFKEARIKTTLNARPTTGSLLFRRRSKRKYVIRINTRKKDSLILLEDVPFNAQVGLFGHELAHFADYHERSFGGVLKRLFAYSNMKGKERYEKEIDEKTVAVGLGWQLYAWSDYVLNHSSGSEAYKTYKRTVYLEPKEIMELISGIPIHSGI